MKRLVAALAVLAALAAPAGAAAHPLGNFTTNRFSRVEISGGHVYVLYVLDLAEIPTYQSRGEVARGGRDAYAARLAGELRTGLRLSVDGDPHPLSEVSHAIAFPGGVGGLVTTRLEVVYDGGALGGRDPVELAYSDGNFADRIGWKEIVVRAEEGARIVSSSAPSESASEELRAYPKDLLKSPLDVTRVEATVEAGDGAGTPPTLAGPSGLTSPVRVAAKSEGGFAALIAKADLGAGVIVLSLLVAIFWGAMHALSPGHGKAIVAAYMVGSRGTARHALLLGLIVTATHTFGVFALGLVTLSLSEFVVPERLYPWLNLASAGCVVAVGIAVLRLRLLDWLRPRRTRGHGRHHHGDHGHQHHGHEQDHRHGHEHGHAHGHGGHGGRNDHRRLPERGSGLRGLVAVGVSGGLLPCPTALVVLLAAISLHRVGYGLLLIVAFSVGLAGAITAIGLLAVAAKRTFSRVNFDGRAVRALPAVSALVILGLGLAMVARSMPAVV